MDEEPVKPLDSDCCGSGCQPCIFDVYEENLKKWKEGRLNRVESTSLSDLKLSPFVIIDFERITESLIVLKFQSVALKDPENVGFPPENLKSGVNYDTQKSPLKIKSGEYLILRGSHQGDVISRSYTPIFREEEFQNGIFTIVVSLVIGGKMSEFFGRLSLGDIAYWRGPYRKFQYRKNSFEWLLMIGGGTGVVPLYNVAKAVVEDEDEQSRVSFLCSFKTLRHFVLRRELNQLRAYWNFQLNSFISTERETDLNAGYGESISFGRIDESVISKELSKRSSNETLFLVSGPELFNKTIETYLINLGIRSDNIFVFWYSCLFLIFSPNIENSAGHNYEFDLSGLNES